MSRKQHPIVVVPSHLEDARLMLGINLPVKVQLQHSVRKRGSHIGPQETTIERQRCVAHIIRLRRDLLPSEATEVLWHELAHAEQAERFKDPAEYNQAYWQQRRDHRCINLKTDAAFDRYQAIPFEVEARTTELLANHHPPLVVWNPDYTPEFMLRCCRREPCPDVTCHVKVPVFTVGETFTLTCPAHDQSWFVRLVTNRSAAWQELITEPHARARIRTIVDLSPEVEVRAA